ncbi:hypothetical protein BR93DRAFT_957270 [Coniochaeta sp. PMI_546]|nr:hypothetical protein BR93DRAFT_957270 [Coniochaeta sp. PMI_546]
MGLRATTATTCSGPCLANTAGYGQAPRRGDKHDMLTLRVKIQAAGPECQEKVVWSHDSGLSPDELREAYHIQQEARPQLKQQCANSCECTIRPWKPMQRLMNLRERVLKTAQQGTMNGYEAQSRRAQIGIQCCCLLRRATGRMIDGLPSGRSIASASTTGSPSVLEKINRSNGSLTGCENRRRRCLAVYGRAKSMMEASVVEAHLGFA